MSHHKLLITIYGREQICASCVGAPGSYDTFEWLQAALGRKYTDNLFEFEYIDIDNEQQRKKHREMIHKMKEEDLFYPLILLNDQIIAEGIPHLKAIYRAIDEYLQ